MANFIKWWERFRDFSIAQLHWLLGAAAAAIWAAPLESAASRLSSGRVVAVVSLLTVLATPKIIYLAARMKSLFLSTLLPRPESTRSDRPSIQSSELGPPTPSTAKECGSPPLDPRGETHSHPDEGVGENQFRRWGIHSGNPAPHIAASMIFPENNK